jgi:hypothetical protein
MAAGLLAAALGGFGKALSGIGEMEAKKQNEAKLRQQLINMESEQRLREDEITRKRAFDYQKLDIIENEPLRTAAEVNRQMALVPTEVYKARQLIPVDVEKTTQVGEAQTRVEAAREAALRAGKIATEVEKTTQVGEAQTRVEAARKEALRAGEILTEEQKGKVQNKLRLELEESLTNIAVNRKEKEARRDAVVLIELSQDKNYISALQKITDAKTSQAEKTQAAAAALKIKNETTLSTLRNKLLSLPDIPQNANARAEIRRQIDDLTDRKAPSYSDAASLANGYLVTANTIERTGTGTEEEKAEAKRYRDMAEQITNAVIQKKLPAATGNKDSGPSVYKVGEERILSDGINKNKIVVWDGKQWNIKK